MKQPWQINTERLANDIIECAKSIRSQNGSEEDLKMKVEPLLQKAFKEIGVDIDIVQYEKTFTSFKGKRDAVYGYLTIEYKKPGELSNRTKIEKLIKPQIQRYLSEQAVQFGLQKDDFLEKAVGVIIDGEKIIFIRFTKSPTILQTPIPIEIEQKELFPYLPAGQGFQSQGPYPVSKSSISNLLIYVRASARRPLTSIELATVFSPTCSITQRAISELYSKITMSTRRQVPARIKAFYDEWKKIFGIVYGQELEKAEKTAEKAAQLYQMPGGTHLQQLLFSIHTFYAFLMKLIAIELISLQRESTITSFVKDLSASDDKELKERLIYLESGADFVHQGIENFLEADFFSWYLDAWNKQLANIFRDIVRLFSDFEPATPILEPEWTKDLLQNLYETIVPQELRHDLGEYYTPDWLAGYVIDKSGYTGNPDVKILDPACGSGTFLIQAIDRVIKNTSEQKNIDLRQTGEHILNNIVGFDINPLAVLTARTNYLIAFSKFIPFVRPIIIPVYLCDSLLAPTKYEEEGEIQFENEVVFKTTKCDYKFPVSIQNKEYIDRFTSKIDIALRGKIKPVEFEKQLQNEFSLPDEDINLLSEIYKQIKTLDDNGKNGIWAKYIKNAFAPVYLGKFDFVIGNPPWIRWDFLSDDYRKATLKLWQKYGLFSLKGYETRLGGGKKDFSMLFTYACADNYLKDSGILGFVITMEVFKSKGAGEGFRQFKFKYNNTDVSLKVLSMEDMVDLKPFTAANKTSIFFLRKCEKTTYPVPSVEWTRKKGIGRILPKWNIETVLSNSERKETNAIPIKPDKINSAWQTAPLSKLKIYDKLNGKNAYKGFTGAFTTPYGVFWLKIKEVRPDKLLFVENLHQRGKWEIKLSPAQIESDLVFPAVSGGEIVKFGIKDNFYLLISQDPKKRRGYDEEYMQYKYPLTYAYLVPFKDILIKRAAYKKYFCKEGEPFAPFYSQFDVSELTFSKYRVTWKQMASKMSAVVLSSVKTDFGTKPMISTHTTAFFSTNTKNEAHYLCAILNSEIVNNFIKSFSAAGRGFGTPSVMENLAIPEFSRKNKIHKKLAELSEKAHNFVKKNADISDIEKQINMEVLKLWNIKS
ncbi:MAG: N-6 DNA methylase [Bacteroidia bacterium]|nr:N-6 DNA methylase [Bacteroidia bacterium]